MVAKPEGKVQCTWMGGWEERICIPLHTGIPSSSWLGDGGETLLLFLRCLFTLWFRVTSYVLVSLFTFEEADTNT